MWVDTEPLFCGYNPADSLPAICSVRTTSHPASSPRLLGGRKNYRIVFGRQRIRGITLGLQAPTLFCHHERLPNSIGPAPSQPPIPDGAIGRLKHQTQRSQPMQDWARQAPPLQLCQSRLKRSWRDCCTKSVRFVETPAIRSESQLPQSCSLWGCISTWTQPASFSTISSHCNMVAFGKPETR